ncbi:glutamate-5-semialdehyde dehydrogenase [Malassezia vespertilionis]|uniref:glutamate-5-semialdehyde dehydrogenase n=1 Tax=Malassezia vespertilionis TaxID=2020962 RepID=A0A2N1JE69_9BASI|nr:glutamate-5-semialdehyde dehydrogenase [Malassezia vespertilionis]PKI84845.1 hypothetical protein MVES_001055 [Malassezia vespertilionis]WFD05787.1 glutamate-5-semialdehyde dehydrogenase [Malassezia vespertilionis]
MTQDLHDVAVVAKDARTAYEESLHLLSELSPAEADAARSDTLREIAAALERLEHEIKAANERDVEEATLLAKQGKLSKQMVSRLDLFAKPGKWDSMVKGVRDVAKLASPLDICTRATRLAEGQEGAGGALDMYSVTCPIGVLLCIFEARPEVIVNIASLAVKSGNAAILKGGKESRRTAAVLARCIAEALSRSVLPLNLVQMVNTREEIQHLVKMDEFIDLVVPRGSKELVLSIQNETRIPVLGHADGLCSAYVHSDAPHALACALVLDSKLDYPSACNAIETLLVHKDHLTSGLWKELAIALLTKGVRLHCDARSLEVVRNEVLPTHDVASLVEAATKADYKTEYLDLELAVRVTDHVEAAVDHINRNGSGHTDIIICAPCSGAKKSMSAAAIFTRSLSSSSVFVNASSRFADGFRFGFGAEVGISTARTHARGPVGLDGLVTYKYIVKGDGDVAHTVGAFAPGENARAWAHTPIEKVYPSV